MVWGFSWLWVTGRRFYYKTQKGPAKCVFCNFCLRALCTVYGVHFPPCSWNFCGFTPEIPCTLHIFVRNDENLHWNYILFWHILWSIFLPYIFAYDAAVSSESISDVTVSSSRKRAPASDQTMKFLLVFLFAFYITKKTSRGSSSRSDYEIFCLFYFSPFT